MTVGELLQAAQGYALCESLSSLDLLASYLLATLPKAVLKRQLPGSLLEWSALYSMRIILSTGPSSWSKSTLNCGPFCRGLNIASPELAG